jgi:threonyl-tRNA synthetase
MTAAVKMIFPDLVLGVGPSTDEGFYQDFDFGEEKVSDSDFKKIEKKMRWIVNKNFQIKKTVIDFETAKKEFAKDKFKQELISDLKEKGETEFSMYDLIDDSGRVFYRDLCAGPHLESTGEGGVFKLTKISGAYWRGDSDRDSLTRIYGVVFATTEELENYQTMLVEAQKRDHRKLGRELDLFSFHDEAPGFPFWHGKGMILMNKLIDFWRDEHKKAGYEEIKTPIILNRKLWEQSGHYEHYRENMYFTKIDDEDFAVKPMNCPGGMLVYKTTLHSYRDFPLRAGELGLVHRHELSGTLHGLFRVRAFTQDDAHIFCTPDQVESEIENLIKLFAKIYKKFGFEFRVELSTRPKKSIGSDEIWKLAESTLEKAIQKTNIEFDINPEDGAFYGPKLDFHLKDAIGRTWQCGTIQLDFSMPERFDLEYVDADGSKKRPVMLHRVIFGSIERFIGILTEHTAGIFPLFCAPVQAVILPVAQSHEEFAKELLEKINENGGRAEIADASETLGKRILNGQKQKIPFFIIIGDDEISSGKLTLRKCGEKKDEKITIEDFLKKLH